MSKFVRIELRETDVTYLICIACGKFHTDYAIVTGGEPQVGLHKKCVDVVHAKRERRG